MLYNSRSEDYKTPFGAVKTGEEVTICVDLPYGLKDAEVVLVLFIREKPERFILMDDQGDHRKQCKFIINEAGTYFYYFKVNTSLYIKRLYEGCGDLNDGDSGELWQLTVYHSNFTTPEKHKGGIYYQLFPDRFYCSGKTYSNVPKDRFLRSDWNGQPFWMPKEEGKFINCDFFGGDLKGIEQKLPYLNSLGVSIIYLNPIFESHSNHRYNTADYYKVDPLLGTKHDFVSLCENAKKAGISIILDGVFSHSGADSVYFNRFKRYGDGGAYNDPASEYVQWYKFFDYPDGYDCWWGFRSLPNLDKTNPDYINFVCGVIKYWLNLGAEGFRLDVADELPDAFIKCLRDAAGDKLLIGEVWEDASNKISYGEQRTYILGGELDSVMNYPFKDAILELLRTANDDNNAAAVFKSRIMTIVENYPRPALDLAMNSLSTHDTLRAITMLAGEEMGTADRRRQSQMVLSKEQYQKGRALLKLAMVLQYFLPGMPCIYYGDEAGLQGYKDPFNRACYPWSREDDELLNHARMLGELRLKLPVLAKGEIDFAHFSAPLIGFCRYNKNENIMVIINPTEREIEFDIPAGNDVVMGNAKKPYGFMILD
ncbi:MAG: glycoside hydrolase family 13 protein [Oscillospiraceae bacterium]|nr:glycoside hydrolase family 13 protein [Oscillospiraceae bacterium]